MANGNGIKWWQKRLNLWIALIVLVGGFSSLYGIFNAINDLRYAKIVDVISRAEATEIKEGLDETRALAQTNAQQLKENADNLEQNTTNLQELKSEFQTHAAVAIVSNMQSELDRHLRDEQPTLVWKEQRDRLRRSLEGAVLYRDCVLAQKSTCQHLNPSQP